MKNVGARHASPKIEVISRDIPPDIYDYLKKAKTVTTEVKEILDLSADTGRERKSGQ